MSKLCVKISPLPHKQLEHNINRWLENNTNIKIVKSTFTSVSELSFRYSYYPLAYFLYECQTANM